MTIKPMSQIQMPLTNEAVSKKSRVNSIDIVRGLVMILMALDHARDFFHFESYLIDPMDPQKTNVPLFLTRWITHVCAPTFIFLAGTSVYFTLKRKSLVDTTKLLFLRGAWLIILQVTIVRFGWLFDIFFRFNSWSILSTIGLCMILLGLLIHVRIKLLFMIALIIIIGHNVLDVIPVGNSLTWSIIHVKRTFELGNGYSFSVLYPIVPWIGVMVLGYCCGVLFEEQYSESRRKVFYLLCAGCLVAFVVLRFSNVYGDPIKWNTNFVATSDLFLSFLAVEKYPPSLLYVLATIGLMFLLFAVIEHVNWIGWRSISLFGKVALFYYVVHIYVFHILMLSIVIFQGYSWKSMVFTGPISRSTSLVPGNFGFSLLMVYCVWAGVVILLYPACAKWYSFKEKNKGKWWVSFV